MIYDYDTKKPDTSGASYIAESADIIGDVILEEGSSIFPNATLRGDIGPIRIGRNSNVQDNSVIHTSHDLPCVVKEDVTVGHGAILHSCTVERGCVIGMGAIILDNAVIGADSMVGAGALVTSGKSFPPRSMILGSPAKAVRELSEEEVAENRLHTEKYAILAARQKDTLRPRG